MNYRCKFYGSIFIPKEKVNEFTNFKMINEFDDSRVEYKVVIKETKKFKYYRIETFLKDTNIKQNCITYIEFIENVYGDLFFHKMDRIVGANMLYVLMKLGFIFDNTDMEIFKEEIKMIKEKNKNEGKAK